jgi:hypothetical protein
MTKVGLLTAVLFALCASPTFAVEEQHYYGHLPIHVRGTLQGRQTHEDVFHSDESTSGLTSPRPRAVQTEAIADQNRMFDRSRRPVLGVDQNPLQLLLSDGYLVG